MSVATTRAPLCSLARASAIAPEPVPTSRTSGWLDLPYVDERPLDHGLGVGAGYQHARVDAQGQPPEPPLAEDVGGRLAPCAPLDERREACLGVRVERAVGAGVELGTRDTERRGQQ